MRPPDSPYRGLAPFDESDLDALFFFGRENDTQVIAANLLAARFTVLYGPTGVGKSSILRAGVVHRARTLAPDALVVVHDSWSGDPDLAAAVAATLPGIDAPERGAPLADRLRELLAPRGGHLYLVLDQFEELFAYRRAQAVADELAGVVDDDGLRVHVLVALREDALSELDVFTGSIRDVFGNHLALDRLDRAAGREAILGPLERYNELSPERIVSVEPELVDVVLDEVEVGRVALANGGQERADLHWGSGIEAPYLQLVMQRLWEAERDAGSTTLRRETLARLGGAGAIVRSHLEDALAGLERHQRDVAARVFNQLVTPSGTKVAHSAGDLAEYAGVPEAELEPVLASLGSDRIVRPLDGRFEIFHDVLADAVLAWRTRHEAERAVESEREEVERRNRRLVTLLTLALLALGAMAAVAAYALVQREHARDRAARAEANRLAAAASALVPVAPVQIDPELGMLLAADAARLAPSERVADILRRALLVSHLRRVLPARGVKQASFDAAGRIVATTEAGEVVVYPPNGRGAVMRLRSDAPLTSAVPSPDGRSVLTTERGGPARIWDVGRKASEMSFGGAPTAASFSPDGSRVLTIEGGRVMVWGGETPRQRDAVRFASFSPNGKSIVTFGDGRRVRVFGVNGRLIANVDQGGGVTSGAVAPDGRLLVTTGRNRSARVWTLPGGRLARELTGHRGQLTGAAISPDGDRVVTTSTDGTARIWDLRSGSLITDLGGHTNHVNGAEWSRDGLSVVTWSADGTARVWRPGTGSTRVVLAGGGDAVTRATFDPTGDLVLTTGADGRAKVWRASVDAQLRVLARTPSPIKTASLSSDGAVAAVAGDFGVWVVRTRDGRRLRALPARDAKALAVDAAGSLVALARGRAVDTVRVGTGESVGTIEADGRATAVAFAPGSSRVAIGTAEGTIAFWTLAGRRLGRLAPPQRHVMSLAISRSGDEVAAGLANGTAAVWRTEDGRRLYQRLGHRPGSRVLSVEFSPTSRRLASSARDSTVRVWSAPTGAPSFVLRGHFAMVSDASFSPNGRWLVSAGPSTVGLWDLISRQRLLFLEGHTGPVLAASFDRTGRRIVSVGADGTVRAYACAVCGGVPELRELAEQRLAATGRRLSAAERRLYLGG